MTRKLNLVFQHRFGLLVEIRFQALLHNVRNTLMSEIPYCFAVVFISQHQCDSVDSSLNEFHIHCFSCVRFGNQDDGLHVFHSKYRFTIVNVSSAVFQSPLVTSPDIEQSESEEHIDLIIVDGVVGQLLDFVSIPHVIQLSVVNSGL